MTWLRNHELEHFLRDRDLLPRLRDCPDCGVQPGFAHRAGCHIECCSVCARQHIACGCGLDGGVPRHDPAFARWTGFLPGFLEALALGLLVQYIPDPEHPIPIDDLGPSSLIPDSSPFPEFERLFLIKPSHPGKPADEVSQTVEAASELNTLAHTIALEDCTSLLEGEAITVWEEDVEWWDMGDEQSFPEALDPAQRYLELRGLLVRHPVHPNWIRIADEPEAGM